MVSNISYGSVQLEQEKKYLIIETFKKIKETIKNDNTVVLQKLINFMYKTVDPSSLVNIYEDESNPIRETHLITLACKYNKPDVLEFLLHKSNILFYLPNHGPIVEKAYIQALCETMRSSNTRMLEILYDYWAGDIHWIGHIEKTNSTTVIQTLQELNKLLVTARDCNECMAYLDKEENRQMLININCLISFNLFQIELYSQLSTLVHNTPHQAQSDQMENEVKAIKSVLLTALKFYEEYSNKRLDYTLGDCSNGLCFMCYLSCELYYRKLDYNIALLIVNNIHILKLRLVMPENIYQEIECAVYYFLYRVKENWKLYLPENILKLRDLPHDPRDTNDLDTFYNYYCFGTVIYREWLKYKQQLNTFYKTLDNTVNNIRKENKFRNDEINSLLLWPYEAMRDDYSVKKILQYLELVSCANFNHDKMNSMLIIQRVIQMTGEFLKGSPETYHLSPTTLALVNMHIPKSTSKQLRQLRDDFSRAKYGKLIRRIDLELNEENVFIDVLKDLDQIKEAINEVLVTYKPTLEKHLITLGLQLIDTRFACMHQEAISYKDDIYDIFTEGLKNKDYVQFCREDVHEYVKKHEWLSKNLFEEIAFLEITYRKLKSEVDKQNQLIKVILMKNIPKYTKTILQIVDNVEKKNKDWKSVSQEILKIQPTVRLMSYPNSQCIENINNILKETTIHKAIKNDIKNKLKNVKDCSVEWHEMKTIIMFIVVQASSLEKNKCDAVTLLSSKIPNTPDITGTRKVRAFVKCLTKCRKQYHGSNSTISQTHAQSLYGYQGVLTMAKKMNTIFFLTKKEICHLKNYMNNICSCDANVICIHRKILEKVYNNIIINEKEYALIINLPNTSINDKCKQIIKNITNGGKRTNNTLECLVNRINLLDDLLKGERNKEKLILRYRQDIKFRNVIDMILSDIMNIYQDRGLTELINLNYSKLLAEYPLRNILDHGNPLLEVCSYTLDAKDFPNALIKFALNVVADRSQLNDLFTLFEDNVDRADVTVHSSDNLNNVQKCLVNNFKTSQNWKIYVKLLTLK